MFVDEISRESEATGLYFLEQFVLQNALLDNCTEIAFEIFNNPPHPHLKTKIIEKQEFLPIL